MHRPAGQNTQTALGETDPSPMKSGWFLVPRSFCLWKGQPLCSPGPLLSLCYARAWSGKEHGEILSSRWTVVLTSKVCNFFLWVPDLMSLHEVRTVLSSALSFPCSGHSRGNLLFCKWKMNGITQVILVYLQQFSSGCFDSA